MDFTPQKIEKVEDEALRILWGDGHRSEFSFRELRLLCRCAQCRDEWTGRLLLEPASVPERVGGERAELVGNYALAFQFSDGHSTGVYTFEMLRRACSCAACARVESR